MMADNQLQQNEVTCAPKRSMGHKLVMKTILRWGSLSLLVLPLALIQAANLTHQEKTFDTTSAPRIGLSNFMGHVVVKGWDKPQVHAIYETGSPQTIIDIDQLPARGPAEKVHFTTRVSTSQAGSGDKTVSYILEVPIGASLEIRNPEGKVEIDKLQGDATVDSVGGIISVTDVSGRLMVSSIAGNIEIIRPSGYVEATSICGDIHFISPTGSSIKAHNTSGKISFEGDFATGGEYSFASYSGDIDLFVPPSASFELNKNTSRGKFISEILPAHRPKSSSLPAGSHTFLGSNVSSTAAVKLSSFSGNIHIHSQR
jgi:putative adhesin